ncbi:MAG: hypothetical protein K0A93_03655 [Desulfuromonadaceae bacterium]|nr:hypothetical protein [Desulfuromonadaceae bacterium]
MELAIDYTCPKCSRRMAVDLRTISPGKIRYCSHCETPLVLSEEALHNFSHRLQQLPLG